MIMKKLAVLALAVVVSVSAAPMLADAAITPGETTYTNDFSSEESLEEWGSYFVADAGLSEQADFSDHWILENGAVRRVNDIQEGAGTKNIAVLTFEACTFKNFELEVKYQKVGEDWPWAVVAIRQMFPGKYFLDDGAGIFVQDEGQVTIWGDPSVQGPHENPQNPSYAKNQEHTFKITAVGTNIKIYVDGVLSKDFTCNESFVRDGYISLMSVNNDIIFDDFSVTKLDDSGNPIPIVEKQEEPNEDDSSVKDSEVEDSSVEDSEVKDSEVEDSEVKDSNQGVSLEDLEKGNNEDDSTLWIVLGVVGVVVVGGVIGCICYLKKNKN